MENKKILAVTSIRSDYGLMSPLYRLLQADPCIELKLIVSGAHMSYTYGHTVDMIENDGFEILIKLETLLDSNSRQSRIKSASLLLQNAIDIVSQYNPDLMIYAGDREDVMVSAIMAGYLGIPSAHFYGGDHTQDGYIDNPVRHAVAKLSTVHMVTMQQHKERLLRLGETEERIHVVGDVSLDNFISHIPSSISELRNKLKINTAFDTSALVIFHPISEEIEKSPIYFENILLNLKNNGIFAFVSFPNSDPGNKAIIEILEKYKNDDGFYCYKNLDRDSFLSIYKNCQFIIGNSSSGILEASSIPIPAINVGLRQRGRIAPENVIFCNTDFDSINAAISKALSTDFQKLIQAVHNPYGDGKSAQKAYEIIKNNDFNRLLAKKEDPLSPAGAPNNDQLSV